MQTLDLLTFLINIIGVIIITWGVILVTFRFLKSEYKNFQKHEIKQKKKISIRQYLATYILLGLEFMIAGDIIHTIIKPTKDYLIILGSIVAIRTVISYFLNKELKTR